MANEYDPLTNWRLSSNFNSVTESDDSHRKGNEISADPDSSASPAKKQTRSRFAKAVFQDDYENEEGDAEVAALSSTSMVPDSYSKSAADKARIPAGMHTRDKDDAEEKQHRPGAKRKLSASDKNGAQHSDDVEVLSAKNTHGRHAFGSKLNPLVVAPSADDDGMKCVVKRQMHIEDYFGAKFTSLHNMLATSTTSPTSSKYSSSARPSAHRTISPVRSSASVPLAKSALLGNTRESSAVNFTQRNPQVLPSATNKPKTAGNHPSPVPSSSTPTSLRRVAHQPAGRSVERTPIMLPSSCRIAYTVRQHQLSLLVDSCLLEFRNDDDITTADIFTKCREEEKVIAESVTSPVAYKNRLRMLLLQIKKNHAFGVAPGSAATSAVTPTSTATATSTMDSAFADVAVVYKLLRPYLLTTEQLIELGFPYFANDEARRRGIAQSSTAKTNEAIGGNGLKLKRICCRCNLPFELTEKGKYVTKSQCIYHPKHAFSRRQPGQGLVQRYLCCDDSVESAGCATCKYHVSNEYPTMHGFVETQQGVDDDGDVAGETATENGDVVNKRVFSLDCEMVYTAGGVEVAKVTVVNHLLEAVYDSFIIPEHQIIDLNARFSGLKREDFNDAAKDLPEVQRDLLRVFGTDSILIGHSLQSDLLALKVVHRKCVDTSMVWPHRRGPPYKRALRNLMREILQMIIQEDEAGHDSKEDASACMRLMLYKIKQDLTKQKTRT